MARGAMGRKKKKESKPWCFYCAREFDDELVLVNHQKAKHFKCHLCSRRLFTAPALVIHCVQVHKEEVKEVANSLPGREDPSVNIYGSEGIPDWAQAEFQAAKGKQGTMRASHFAMYGVALTKPTTFFRYQPACHRPSVPKRRSRRKPRYKLQVASHRVWLVA